MGTQLDSLWEGGDLAAAIAETTERVRRQPTEVAARTFLFELLSFAGELDRAQRQLDVLAHQDGGALTGIQVYQNVLAAERLRRRWYENNLRPALVTEEPAYTHHYLDAAVAMREDRLDDANALLDEGDARRPPVSGTLNGEAFAGFCDADELLGPFLEVYILDRYVWLPVDEVRSIELEAPKHPRDLLWARAKITGWRNPFGEAFVPVLYGGSAAHADDRVKLGRMTCWSRAGDRGPFRGLGQRILLAGEREVSVLDIRHLVFDPPKVEEH